MCVPICGQCELGEEDLGTTQANGPRRACAAPAWSQATCRCASAAAGRRLGRSRARSDGGRDPREARSRARCNPEPWTCLVSAQEARFAAEKKSLHAIERDSEANQKRREEFIENIRTISPERLIFLDESGVTTSMTRLYARSLGGSRICEGTPDGRWKMLTILGALSTRGVVATMTIEEATDGDIFLAYLDHCLCPQLRAGDVVVMDN